jgi:hypothetical protein
MAVIIGRCCCCCSQTDAGAAGAIVVGLVEIRPGEGKSMGERLLCLSTWTTEFGGGGMDDGWMA